MADLIVIGGGLAGCEAAWQAAQRGLKVELYEMRPNITTGAHRGALLAELVCSNSLGSRLLDRASGLLKEELRRLGSLLLVCAEESSLPAGGALAVDREVFAQRVTEMIEGHENIRVIRREVRQIPESPTIVASGPLTSSALSQAIAQYIGDEHLYFYDAIAPVIYGESIDMEVAFRASRYQRGEQDAGDYINCPFTRDEYYVFVQALVSAERIELREFEQVLQEGVRAGVSQYFEGCLPVEILAQRGQEALAFGPLRPVGLVDPRTGRRPYAVAQLRQDNLAGTLFNLVGFQTNLKFSEQQRVFRMIPGLEQAEFARYGQMHRNTFIFSPAHLRPTLQHRRRDDLFFAGQITGIEGYAGNIASGLLAGLNAARLMRGQPPLELPTTTMLGAMCHYVTHASAADFQPMKANFGLLPPLEGDSFARDKRRRYQAYVQRALSDLDQFMTSAWIYVRAVKTI
ncbi:MAG: methylenetetrahydrofolate--tRNA-(uracil(54)-C(5))-methyltransferase (FADH(2)-oxidizing) TrmFO [Anaerolineales bacterium]|nr:methylenetetrahydrofolate--tRNA-(uracil(54)-C(5))-methyltransferase (FADH(2)-oxidizing) TrmFO [Anaerolineales bacterium]